MTGATVSERNWWVGLRCTICSEPVKVNGEGSFVMPVLAAGKLGQPSAEHHRCRERRRAASRVAR